jgi:hypothetical protein
MKSPMLRTLLVVAVALLLAGLWRLAGEEAWDGWPHQLVLRALPASGFAALATAACRRLRDEDRGARLDAERCRRRGAPGRDDDALAEADLLLARLAVHADTGAQDEAASQDARLEAQLAQVQAELTQLQQQAAFDLVQAARMDSVRDRPAQATVIVRSAGGAAWPG